MSFNSSHPSSPVTPAHPAECGKIIRSYHTENDRPWGSVGIIFDGLRNNSENKLITIKGSMQTPADWQGTIVTGKSVRRAIEDRNEPAIRGQSTSSYSTTS